VTAQETPATARRRHKGHFERGAAAVEMALVMPLLILMVMGIIDFGRIFNGEIQLSQAAREGARIAALGASGPYSSTNVSDRAKAALTNPAFQGNASVGVTVRVVDGSGTTMAANAVCAASDSTANYGEVTVTIPYSKILFGPASLSQKAVMKCSG
jgi:Flp pilus assembly protein TadG